MNMKVTSIKQAEDLNDLCKDLARTSGSLKHATKQASMYPGSENAKSWYDSRKEEFLKYHKQYMALVAEMGIEDDDATK